MSQDYKLEKVLINDKWDDFVLAAKDGTVFSLSKYLLSLNARPIAYYCLKNETIKAGLVLIENDKRDSIISHDFVIYSGIIFSNPLKEQNKSKINSEKFRITTFIADQLSKIYHNIQLTLHPSIVDLRPFLWVNYNTKLPKYRLEPRYTSYINIEDIYDAKSIDNISIYKNASYSRRQEIRYGIKKNVTTNVEFDSDKFINFYHKTMERQSIIPNTKTLNEMKDLINSLYENNLGKMFVSYTNDGILGSMAFFAIDNKRAYFLFGANDPKMRSAHTGTMVLWDAFRFLNKEKIKEIDLEGINSPHRGWFKLSFGGNIIPYYHIYFDNKIIAR